MTGFIIVLVLFGVLLITFRLLNRVRGDKMQDIAKSMGMTFIPIDKDKVHLKKISQFQLGRSGDERVAKNIMVGTTNETRVTLMDYLFTSGVTKYQKLNQQTIAIFEQSNLGIPSFILKPEGLGEKIKSTIGKSEALKFNDTPLFSKKYSLSSIEEDKASILFSTELRKQFEENLNWYVESQSGLLLICRLGEQNQPHEMGLFLQDVLSVKKALEEEGKN